MTKPCPPDYVNIVLKRLTENGFAAHMVGGCVRDCIMGRPVHDWDVATSAMPSITAQLFERTVVTGKKYGTVTVIQPEGAVEVTTYRTESGYNDSRHPENVRFVDDLEDDLQRRDFTINAMAVSVTGAITDPFGGQKDIADRVIRCVGDPALRFNEDALRMFRAYRFSAELGFEIAQGTMSAIADNAYKAKLISAERIRVELEKTLTSPSPETVGQIINAGLLDKYLSGRIDGTKMRISGTKIKSVSQLPYLPALRWCSFCAILLDCGLISSVSMFLRALRHDRKTIKACTIALAIPGIPDDTIGIKRLLAKHGALVVRCAAAAQDALSVSEGGAHPSDTYIKQVDEVIASGECFSLKDMAVSGSDLITSGHPPGARLGKTLDALLGHVIEHPEDNTREVLLELTRQEAEGKTLKF